MRRTTNCRGQAQADANSESPAADTCDGHGYTDDEAEDDPQEGGGGKICAAAICCATLGDSLFCIRVEYFGSSCGVVDDESTGGKV